MSFKVVPELVEQTDHNVINQILTAYATNQSPQIKQLSKACSDKVESVRLAYIASGGSIEQIEMGIGLKTVRAMELFKGIDFRSVTAYELTMLQELTRMNNAKPTGTRDIAQEVLKARKRRIT